MQYSVFVCIFCSVQSVCTYICTGPWKSYLPPESQKYATFCMGTELLQRYGTERVSRLKFSPVHWFSHSLDTSVARGFSNRERSASSPVLELILMALLGKKKEKVRLCGLELFLLALRSDSVRGEQLRQERQLLTFIFHLWLGRDGTHTLPPAPLQELEHLSKYHKYVML